MKQNECGHLHEYDVTAIWAARRDYECRDCGRHRLGPLPEECDHPGMRRVVADHPDSRWVCDACLGSLELPQTAGLGRA